MVLVGSVSGLTERSKRITVTVLRQSGRRYHYCRQGRDCRSNHKRISLSIKEKQSRPNTSHLDIVFHLIIASVGNLFDQDDQLQVQTQEPALAGRTS